MRAFIPILGRLYRLADNNLVEFFLNALIEHSRLHETLFN